jgi:hypothetical protein
VSVSIDRNTIVILADSISNSVATYRQTTFSVFADGINVNAAT